MMERSEAARYDRAALVLLGVLLVFRLWYAGAHGIIGDEAHYWLWSRKLAAGFYDQGPFIAFAIRAGTTLFGADTFGVRFVPVLLGIGAGWLGYQMVRTWLGARIALVSLVLLSVAPLLALGGMLATYDNPMVFWWTASLWALTRVLHTEKPRDWYVLGACVGLGLLSKLTMILFAPCTLLCLLLVPRYRRYLATPHPYLAFALALVIASPLIAWNAGHGWPNVMHAQALSSRSRGKGWFHWFGEFLAGQVLAVGPVFFLAEFWILVKLALRARAGKWTDAEAFLWSFSAPILFICLFIAAKSRVEANWPAPMHITALPLVAMAFYAAFEARRASRWWLPVGAGIAGLMVMVILFPAVITLTGVRLSADIGQKANETYGWDQVNAGVTDARRRIEQEGKPYFMAGVNYRAPAVVALMQPDHPDVTQLFLATRRNQFLFWPPTQQQMLGQNALLFWDDEKPSQVALLNTCFESVEPLPPIVVTRPGFTGPVKLWRIFLCRNFRGYDLNANLEGW